MRLKRKAPSLELTADSDVRLLTLDGDVKSAAARNWTIRNLGRCTPVAINSRGNQRNEHESKQIRFGCRKWHSDVGLFGGKRIGCVCLRWQRLLGC